MHSALYAVLVWALEDQLFVNYFSPRQASEENQGWIGYLTKAVSASANYLPSQVTDVFNQGRAFASVHLPFQGLRNVCAITM
jgi:autophagy-related protein 18